MQEIYSGPFRGQNGQRVPFSRIVENEEIYKGDVLMQKTFIDGKRHPEIQNRGEKAMYYAKDNHPPIVSEKYGKKHSGSWKT